ncbi:glycoside hydrolase family 25 protein [Corynebacterium rouxii]|uniref:Glycoside hydrolase family 25 n=1 Tax=Corynebacterium rouxii TaxID=2719119 RepID=A0A6I8MIH5_9CORY|nr:GH25 family lysozyme [Corynebacterium rouxii]VZH85922.1 glycoside hydrolase family 25 [Corynebacterium rouxii]
MTIYGVDVSVHQNGLSLVQAKKEGYDFCILRMCDGTFRDVAFRSHLVDAEAAGMLISVYWYLRAPSEGTTIAQQVDMIDSQLQGRKDLAVWIDVESVTKAGIKTLTGADVWAAKKELERRGYTVAGVYSGAWYWENMPGGEPSMQGLGYLWVSSYGRNLNDYGSVAYEADGGANHRGWKYPLGDKLPDILQFGSNGKVAGFREVDVNAFEGTLDELRTIFAA